ncbi:Mo-dependent nitrogenase C-terminal domain-containing protein [Kovacikia minuta CCNUW1]|uniref:Mo-dependent nitrogenase C-terminal domain-containing protein n=1 Tax=Kovacikia minuta TaxID=2931930 RepID=UPI001CCA1C21|nr:Mo-dependent nitrogenase C-terminal domain-containing protein [Kovacikia minuta]UBF24627.1 Mo-dependent nitrogenase C-terminal domain-containing protein [Kovacikia minuta CCNUW1]
MNRSRYETPTPNVEKFVWISKEVKLDVAVTHDQPAQKAPFAPLQPIRQALDNFQIYRPKTARLICRLIPASCPFARTIKLFNRTLFQIPPLCKLNPFYEEFVGLRFRALSYLADHCNEDISRYC